MNFGYEMSIGPRLEMGNPITKQKISIYKWDFLFSNGPEAMALGAVWARAEPRGGVEVRVCVTTAEDIFRPLALSPFYKVAALL